MDRSAGDWAESSLYSNVDVDWYEHQVHVISAIGPRLSVLSEAIVGLLHKQFKVFVHEHVRVAQ